MKLKFLKSYYYDKNGKINYEKASKHFGLSKSDLQFFHKGHFSLIDTPTLMTGVLVGYRPTSNNPMFYSPWRMQTCYHSNDDLSRIYGIITGSSYPAWSTYDYFIMDSSGKVIYTNFKMNQQIDENGVIHLTAPEHGLDNVVYPAERRKYGYKCYYCYGKDMKSLNEQIKYVADAKVIKLPKHFKRGFVKTENLEKA